MTTIRVSDDTKKRLEGFKQYMGLRSLDEALKLMLDISTSPLEEMDTGMDMGLMQNLSRSEGREMKIGRNEPCPCGSGQKYKRCHGKP